MSLSIEACNIIIHELNVLLDEGFTDGPIEDVEGALMELEDYVRSLNFDLDPPKEG